MLKSRTGVQLQNQTAPSKWDQYRLPKSVWKGAVVLILKGALCLLLYYMLFVGVTLCFMLQEV